MPLSWFERPLLALAAILLPAMLVHAALQNPRGAARAGVTRRPDPDRFACIA
jgi:hypothetical protein